MDNTSYMHAWSLVSVSLMIVCPSVMCTSVVYTFYPPPPKKNQTVKVVLNSNLQSKSSTRINLVNLHSGMMAITITPLYNSHYIHNNDKNVFDGNAMWMFPINDNNMVTSIRHEIIIHTYLGYYMQNAFVIMLQKQRCISFCIRAHQNKGLLCNCYTIFCKQLVAS